LSAAARRKTNSDSNSTAVVPPQVLPRVLQRILAMTAAIWHNWHTGQPIMRSLTAYDH
jgi:hypothetical protein